MAVAGLLAVSAAADPAADGLDVFVFNFHLDMFFKFSLELGFRLSGKIQAEYESEKPVNHINIYFHNNRHPLLRILALYACANKIGKAMCIVAFPGYTGLRSGRGCPGADPPDYKDTTTIVLQRTLLCERAFRPIRCRALRFYSSYARYRAILMPAMRKPGISE